MAKTVKCPYCEKPAEYSEENPFRPFCSERCRLIDLGAWADEQHKLPSKEPLSEQDLEIILKSKESEQPDN